MTGVVAAVQRALAAENEAVFGYGLLGPHLADADVDLARSASTAHEQLRDAMQSLLADRHVIPDPPQADYPDLPAVADAAAARSLALRLETGAATAWRAAFAAAVAVSPPDTVVRNRAQSALVDAAVRAMRWRLAIGSGSPTVPFPGL